MRKDESECFFGNRKSYLERLMLSDLDVGW